MQINAQGRKLAGVVTQISIHDTAEAMAGSIRQIGSTSRRSRGEAKALALNNARPVTSLMMATMMSDEVGKIKKLKILEYCCVNV
jgi:hypothetical protein